MEDKEIKKAERKGFFQACKYFAILALGFYLGQSQGNFEVASIVGGLDNPIELTTSETLPVDEIGNLIEAGE